MIRSRFRPHVYAICFFAVVAVVFYGSMIWTAALSFTSSRLLPSYDFVGFDQYARLLSMPRWKTACLNLAILGVFSVTGSIALGTLLAVTLDRDVRGEGVIRSIYLYPLAISLIVTGLAWRWLLDPVTGVQAVMRSWGWESFSFAWLSSSQMAIYALVIASIWRSAGLVMIIVLAGLRGVDRDIWKAIRIEGIPVRTAYLRVILPSLKLTFFSVMILLLSDLVRSYDLVIAMTGGGPGFSTDIPAKFVVDHFFGRANIGLGSAASVIVMIMAMVALIPFFLTERKGK